jgi:hypothetical protein
MPDPALFDRVAADRVERHDLGSDSDRFAGGTTFSHEPGGLGLQAGREVGSAVGSGSGRHQPDVSVGVFNVYLMARSMPMWVSQIRATWELGD